MVELTRRRTLSATGTVTGASGAGCMAIERQESETPRVGQPPETTEAPSPYPVEQTESGSQAIIVNAGNATKRINIEAHERPIQEAIDTLTATGEGGQGRVTLPPNSVIEEAGTIQMDRGIELTCPSLSTKIQITKQGVPGIEIGGADGCRLHNFILSGPAAEDPQSKTGPGILNTGGVNDISIGHINIYSWNNSAIKCANLDEDFFWASNIDHIRTGVDAGDEKGEFVLKGLALSFGLLHCYPHSEYSGKNSDILFLTDTACNIGFMNIGGACGRAIYQESAPITVGGVNYEPTEQVEVPPEVISLGGASGWRNGSIIGQVTSVRHENPHEANRLAEYCYTLRERNMGHLLSHPSRPQNFRENVLNVAGKPMEAIAAESDRYPPYASPSFYLGYKRDVDNNAGTDSGAVRALGSAGDPVA